MKTYKNQPRLKDGRFTFKPGKSRYSEKHIEHAWIAGANSHGGFLTMKQKLNIYKNQNNIF